MSGITLQKPVATLSNSLLTSKGGARPGQRYDNEVTEVYQSRRRITLNAERVRDISDFIGSSDETQHNIADDETAVLVQPVAIEAMSSNEAMSPNTMPLAVSTWREGDKLPGARAAGGKARVAYTVRLDADRHANLRFTASSQHRSAQQVMLDALDRYLSVAVPFLLNDH
jgi:hypothetical protein